MPNTTNYNWATPADTDLVKDGAAAIRTLGSSADTTVKNLNPGTTAGDIDYYTSSTAKARVAIGTAGQVLRVNSGGTAPEWATTADQTPLTTKGDLFTFTTVDARLGVGANGTVLTADSAEATGLKWAAPGAGANWTLVNSGGTALTGAATITVSGISGADKLLIFVSGGASSDTASSKMTFRLNGDSGANYYSSGVRYISNGTYSSGNLQGDYFDSTSFSLGKMSNNAASDGGMYALLSGCNSSGVKVFNSAGGFSDPGDGANAYILGGYYNSSSTISSISLISSVGNFDKGTLYVYKSA